MSVFSHKVSVLTRTGKFRKGRSDLASSKSLKRPAVTSCEFLRGVGLDIAVVTGDESRRAILELTEVV